MKGNSMEKCKYLFILCGGMGTRIRDILGDCPKVLAPIDEDTVFLDILVEQAEKNSIENIVLCTGVYADKITEYINQKNYPIKIHISHEKQTMGTGGAISLALSRFTTSGPIAIANGDTFISWPIKEMQELFNDQNVAGSILLSKAKDNSKGAVGIDRNHRINSFHEKSENSHLDHINAGLYLLNKSIVEEWPLEAFSLEYDVLPQLVQKLCIKAFITPEALYDFGTPEGMESFKKLLKESHLS